MDPFFQFTHSIMYTFGHPILRYIPTLDFLNQENLLHWTIYQTKFANEYQSVAARFLNIVIINL